jgi:translation initiation factor 4E
MSVPETTELIMGDTTTTTTTTVLDEDLESSGGVVVGGAGDEDGTKHQLQNKWKFWYFENNKDKSWEDNLRVVSEFYTVEDFWSIYNHIKNASELRPGCSYFVFKDGIKPMWEDPVNRPGGRWLVSFDRRQRQQLDNLWLEVVSDSMNKGKWLLLEFKIIRYFVCLQLLCLIGEAFDDDGDDICGVVVDVRGKMDKISIWTSDCKNKDRIVNIG